MKNSEKIQKIHDAQEHAKEAYEAYQNLSEILTKSEELLAEREISVTVNHRKPREPHIDQEINTLALLFCNTYLNIRFKQFLGEEAGQQDVLLVTNHQSGFSREYTLKFPPAKIVDQEAKTEFDMVSARDGAEFLLQLMVDFIQNQKRKPASDQVTILQNSITDALVPPEIGRWWGGSYGFVVREQRRRSDPMVGSGESVI